jgi:hypothetical protein
MKADVNQAVNAFKQDAGLGRGMLARLKNTSVTLIFLGIYSTNTYAEGIFSIDPRIDNLMTIGFGEGQVFTVPSPDATVAITPGVSGTLSYTWANTTGKLEFLDVTAHFQTHTATTGLGVVGPADLISVPLPSDPVGGPEISHTGTATFNQTFAPPLSFGVGNHSLSVTIFMQPTATPNQGFAIQPFYSFAVQAVPEPETYAMFLTGLGLIGWRMRRSTKYQRTAAR